MSTTESQLMANMPLPPQPPSQIPQQSGESQSQPSSSSSNRQSISSKSRRAPREVRFGAYILGSTLGEGEFGKVKLGWRKDGKQPSQAAIKLIRRNCIPRGSEKENKIYREINALKKLAHPNIVRLEEVLQNDKYIGIVLEYASGGELFDYILEHRYLKESMACRLFAQLVSGVDYMHSKGIVHRDLKLENLLLDKHKNIIITDFGFVNSFHGNDFMKTSCGSPCYAAPELVVSSEPYEGRKVDVWSCGVILYAMLAGYLPFDDDPQNPDGDNIARLYHYITHTPLTFPEYIQPTPRDLLRKIIVSNPRKRIDLKQVRSHPWLAPHAPFLSVTPVEWDRNHRSTRQRTVLTAAERSNRRLSLMENPTSASFMLNKSNMKSYSTQNVSAILYSNPAAPQTSSSHVMGISSSSSNASIGDSHISSSVSQQTIPISNPSYIPTSSSTVLNTPTAGGFSSSSSPTPTPTSPVANELNINNNNDNNNNNNITDSVPIDNEFKAPQNPQLSTSVSSSSSPIPSSSSTFGAHNRSNSSTSIVLQAIVEADKVEHSRRNSLSNENSIYSKSNNSRSSLFEKPSLNPSGSNNLYVPGVSVNPFETIEEDPSTKSPENKMLPPVLPPSRNTGNVTKLPSRSRPRPTSYHPGTVSTSSYQFPSPDLSSLLSFASTEYNLLARPKIDREPSSSNSIKNSPLNSLSSSPTKEKRNSWCQPKVSEPILDMSMANGVLTKLNDLSLDLSETTSNTNSNISNSSNQLSPSETIENNPLLESPINVVANKKENRKSIAIDSLNSAIDMFGGPDKGLGQVVSPKIQSHLEKNAELEDENNKKVSLVHDSDESGDNTITENDTVALTDTQDNNSAKENIITEVPAGTPSVNQRRKVSNQNSLSKSNAAQQHNSSMKSHSSVDVSEKENKVYHQHSTNSNANRSKRFSLLSFYSLSNSSVDSQLKPPQNENTPSSSSSNLSQPTVTTNQSSKKVLEPSKHMNVKKSNRASMDVKANRRMSLQNTPQGSSKQETSTAKRVMDFFRRRSIRI